MIDVAGRPQSYWSRLARVYWLTGAPLRPMREDVLHLEQLVKRHAQRPPVGPLRASMLGVTPDIAGMKWPDGTRLVAVDQSWPMVSEIWPGNVPGVRQAVCGDWQSLPLADRSCHVLTGDGAANCVPYPDGLRQLAAEAARVLRPEGCLVLRCYTQLETPEDPGQLLASLWEGEIRSFHEFKFRLLMALQETAREGVRVADVYRYWTRSGIDPERLARSQGWDPAIVHALEAYEDSPTVHVFPTLAELREVLRQYFEEVSCSYASYPLAERCPVLVLRPAGLVSEG